MLRGTLHRGLAALAFIFVAGDVAQAQVIDQQQVPFNGGGSYDWSRRRKGESFIPTANTVVGAGVYALNCCYETNSVELTAQLWSGLPDNGGTLLAGATQTFSLLNGLDNRAWLDIFWPAVAVTPGNTYYLAFWGADEHADGTLGFQVWTGNPNPGSFVWNTGNSPDGPLDVFPGTEDWDLTFREFAEGQEAQSAPEPGSFVLIATGLAGVGRIARRRRSV